MFERITGLSILSFERVNRPEFKPKPWRSPEPLKDAQARALEYSMNAASLTEICNARGRNFEDVVREKAREHELLAELGLTPAHITSVALEQELEDEPEEPPAELPAPDDQSRRRGYRRRRYLGTYRAKS